MRLPEKSSNNAHMFYLLCANEEQRSTIISYLESQGIMAVFHYQSLHTSSYYKDKHDESVKKLHKCDTCAKSFIFPSELRKHERIHSSASSFKCEVCNKTCASTGSLRNHQTTHLTVKAIKAYECNECEKTFESYNGLKHHVTKNHSGL